jgi:hypothetical protein
VPYYNNEDEPIVPEDGDKVILCVKCARKVIIKKELTAADYDEEEQALKLIMKPEDTINLPPSDYRYDCLYIFANGEAYTFIDKAIFKIVEAIAKKPEG